MSEPQMMIECEAIAAEITAMVQRKLHVTEALGTTIPKYAPRVADDTAAERGTGDLVRAVPLSERRCCALVGDRLHCGLPIQLPWTNRMTKCLCNGHMKQLMELEHMKKTMCDRRTTVLQAEPTPMTAAWTSRFMRLSMWTMFLRQHIVLCFFPPGTYGAAFTRGHLYAIDFMDREVRCVVSKVRRIATAAAAADEQTLLSSSFGALRVNGGDAMEDDEHEEREEAEEEEEGDPWDASAFLRMGALEQTACLQEMQEMDDDIMASLGRSFRVHVDDIRRRATEMWHGIQPIDESHIVLSTPDVDFADLARFFYLHASVTEWLDAVVSKKGQLHRFNTPENLKRVLDVLVMRCLPTHAMEKISEAPAAARHAVVHLHNVYLHATDGYGLCASLLPPQLRIAVHNTEQLRVLCDTYTAVHDKMLCNAWVDDAHAHNGVSIHTLDELRLEQVGFIFLDARGDLAVADRVGEACRMIIGPMSIIMPALAYSLFWKAFVKLDVHTVHREVPLAGDDARLEAYLCEHLPTSRWHLFAHAHAAHVAGSPQTCYALVETPHILIVIDCLWNPMCDRDPRMQDKLRISTAISLSFAATTLRDVAGSSSSPQPYIATPHLHASTLPDDITGPHTSLPAGLGHCRSYVVDRIRGGMDIETRKYTRASEIARYATCRLGPLHFFNKTARGKQSAQDMCASLCTVVADTPSDPVYYAAGHGVTLTTSAPPLRNLCELPNASRFDLASETSHIVFTRNMLGEKSHPEALWQQASITLHGKTMQQADECFEPSRLDVKTARSSAETHMPMNDRKERWIQMVRDAVARRRRR